MFVFVAEMCLLKATYSWVFVFNPSFTLCRFFKAFLKERSIHSFIHSFIERGEGQEKEEEKYRCMRETLLGCLSCAPTGDPAHSPGMYPDWEFRIRPATFGLWDNAQPTEPQQSGLLCAFLLVSSVHSVHLGWLLLYEDLTTAILSFSLLVALYLHYFFSLVFLSAILDWWFSMIFFPLIFSLMVHVSALDFF